MNERKIKEIEKLIGKFFDGETTLREEQRLYEFLPAAACPPVFKAIAKCLPALPLCRPESPAV